MTSFFDNLRHSREKLPEPNFAGLDIAVNMYLAAVKANMLNAHSPSCEPINTAETLDGMHEAFGLPLDLFVEEERALVSTSFFRLQSAILSHSGLDPEQTVRALLCSIDGATGTIRTLRSADNAMPAELMSPLAASAVTHKAIRKAPGSIGEKYLYESATGVTRARIVGKYIKLYARSLPAAWIGK